jgi:hypothetical protein
MRIIKRIAVLLIELLAEALLLGGLLGAMVSAQIGLKNGMIGSMLAVPVILGLHGYYVSRVLATVAWASKAKWLYPAIAATVFVAHVLVIASQFKSDLSFYAQRLILPFLVGGACIVFACSFAGIQLFRMWSQANERRLVAHT